MAQDNTSSSNSLQSSLNTTNINDFNKYSSLVDKNNYYSDDTHDDTDNDTISSSSSSSSGSSSGSTDANNDTMNDNNNLYVIGYNGWGNLGVGHTNDVKKLTAHNIHKHHKIKHIHNGNRYTIYTDCGNKNCWSAGSNEYGECGIIPKYNKIYTSAAGHTTFWIDDKNNIYGHGRNDCYQLGVNTNTNHYEAILIDNLPPNIIDIKPGSYHSIALTENGAVYSTGTGKGFGAHGHGKDDIKKWTKIKTFKNKKIIKTTVGQYHTLFLQENGVIWCCGYNTSGELGLNHTTTQYFPIQITFFTNNNIKIKDICTGYDHNLAIDYNNKIYSWGFNTNGECGNGTTNDILIPTIMESLKDKHIKNIKCGGTHSYALSDDNIHYLWGSNNYNESSIKKNKSNGTTLPNAIDVKYMNGKNIKEIYLGTLNTAIIVYSNEDNENIINGYIKKIQLIHDFPSSLAKLIKFFFDTIFGYYLV